MKLLAAFILALISVAYGQNAPVDITGRWFLLSTSNNIFGSCAVIDIVKTGNASPKREKFVFQSVGFDSFAAKRKAIILTDTFEVEGRRIFSDGGGGFFLVKRSGFLVSVSSRVMVLSRTPIAPNRLRIGNFITRLLGEKPIIVPQRKCVHAPYSVPRLSQSRFSGLYYDMLAFSTDFSVKNVKCAVSNYKITGPNSFFYAGARIRRGKFEGEVGTMKREYPAFKGRYTLSVSGFRSFKVWVLKLGPVVRGKYEFVVMATPSLSTIFVSARNPRRFIRYYKWPVLRYLKLKYKLKARIFTEIRFGKKCYHVVHKVLYGKRFKRA